MRTADLFALTMMAGALLILCAWRAVVALRPLIAAYAPAQVAGRRLRAKIRRMRRALVRGGAAGGR